MKLAQRPHTLLLTPSHALRLHRARSSRHSWIRPLLDALTPYLIAAATLLAYHEGMFG